MSSIRRARKLRDNSTDAERRLWQRLRDRQLDGHKFRRQQPIGSYVLDFVCQNHHLIVELDGGQHVENKDADDRRDAWLTAAGYRVLRFWNHEVYENIEGVLQKILFELGTDA